MALRAETSPLAARYDTFPPHHELQLEKCAQPPSDTGTLRNPRARIGKMQAKNLPNQLQQTLSHQRRSGHGHKSFKSLIHWPTHNSAGVVSVQRSTWTIVQTLGVPARIVVCSSEASQALDSC